MVDQALSLPESGHHSGEMLRRGVGQSSAAGRGDGITALEREVRRAVTGFSQQQQLILGSIVSFKMNRRPEAIVNVPLSPPEARRMG